MKIAFRTCLLLVGLGTTMASVAHADVWKWVDQTGRTHFVDTMKPIFTWTDNSGKVYFSDKPDHEDAISVQLVWHSPGTLEDLDGESADLDDPSAVPNETPEEREERRKAEAYYCKRATEIYESYVNAPNLYRTDENGERVYLTEEEMAATVAETKARKDELCQ